ncbi:MAG: radical SAM protein [Lachnospiraceae bacterium]|nr:radical SAM protein [Lachnospiraceae bacterium]
MEAITDKAVYDMHLSVSMEIQLRQINDYLAAAGVDPYAVIMRFYEDGSLPVRSKEAGKAVLKNYRAAALAEAENALRSAAAFCADSGNTLTDHNTAGPARKISRICVEKDALKYPLTGRILEKLGSEGEDPQEIESYKDVFYNKSGYSNETGRRLILAVRRDKLIMEGSGFCQDFGNSNFYYASCAMNCIYDCEYCYLKGMYPSDDLVIFVNIEDYFEKLREMLAGHPVYLCISYDTDLAALEYLTGFISKWNSFAAENNNLTLEVRSKSAAGRLWDNAPLENVIYAFTLSPDIICRMYEKAAPGLSARLSCIKEGLEKGFRVRVCFDPLLAIPDWEEEYGSVIDMLGEEPYRSGLYDLSCGTFRISSAYLKNMRKRFRSSTVCQYPYELKEGAYSYGEELSRRMSAFVKERLKDYFPEDRIYVWNE